jgi:hypothetical protein
VATRARPQRRRRRRRRWGRTILRVLGIIVLLALGAALGDAIAHRPSTTRTVTRIRPLQPVPVTQTVGTRTLTVVVTRAP